MTTTPKPDLYQFIGADYFATGEGRTVMLLITRAYPHVEDYVGEYPDQTLKNSAKFRSAREFVNRFGHYYAQCAENLPREEFLKRYQHFLPEVTLKMLTSDDQPGNMSFSQEFHFNFS